MPNSILNLSPEKACSRTLGERKAFDSFVEKLSEVRDLSSSPPSLIKRPVEWFPLYWVINAMTNTQLTVKEGHERLRVLLPLFGGHEIVDSLIQEEYFERYTAFQYLFTVLPIQTQNEDWRLHDLARRFVDNKAKLFVKTKKGEEFVEGSALLHSMRAATETLNRSASWKKTWRYMMDSLSFDELKDIRSWGDFDDDTLLHESVRHNLLDLTQMLLEHYGFDPATQNLQEQTPVCLALVRGQGETIQYFKSQGFYQSKKSDLFGLHLTSKSWNWLKSLGAIPSVNQDQLSWCIYQQSERMSLKMFIEVWKEWSRFSESEKTLFSSVCQGPLFCPRHEGPQDARLKWLVERLPSGWWQEEVQDISMLKTSPIPLNPLAHLSNPLKPWFHSILSQKMHQELAKGIPHPKTSPSLKTPRL